MCRRTDLACVATSNPATVAAPDVGRAKVQSILMVVDLPGAVWSEKGEDLPLGHRKVDPVDRSQIAVALGEIFYLNSEGWGLLARCSRPLGREHAHG